MSSQSKRKTGAWSPEARAKAQATRAATMAAKKATTETAVSLDAIPDRPERKKYKKRERTPFVMAPLSQDQMDTVKALLKAALKMME